MSGPDPSPPMRAAPALLFAFLIAAAVFNTWPGLDLWVSGLFYQPGTGFPLATERVSVALRWIVWRFSEIMVLAAGLGVVVALFRTRLLGVDPRRWFFVLALYALGPGLLVDGLLKRYSGRARPADITQFGGQHHFSAALDLADQCLRNCSFVSGEGAGVVAFAISMAVLARDPGLPAGPGLRRGLFWFGIADAVVGSFLRVTAGRHFLSDIVFAAIFVIAIAVLLRPMLGPAAAGVSASASGDGR